MEREDSAQKESQTEEVTGVVVEEKQGDTNRSANTTNSEEIVDADVIEEPNVNHSGQVKETNRETTSDSTADKSHAPTVPIFDEDQETLKTLYVRDRQAPTEAKTAERPTIPLTEAKAVSAEDNAVDDSEAYTETLLFTPEGMRARVRSVFGKAKEGLLKAKNTLKDAPLVAAVKASRLRLSAKEYFNDEERGSARRRTAKAAGVVALFGTMYSAYKLGTADFFEGSSSAEAIGGPSQTPGVEVAEDVVKTDVKSASAPEASVVTMRLDRQNETISHVAQAFLQDHGYEVTNDNIYKLTNAILEKQGLTYEDARHLPVGYKVTIPQDILDNLALTKQK